MGRITGTCAACGRPGHRFGTTHGPDAPDRWDPIACINGLMGEVDELRGALERIATYEVPGTGVYRNTDAAEYARRVLDEHTAGSRAGERSTTDASGTART